jgi:hypothetical protein
MIIIRNRLITLATDLPETRMSFTPVSQDQAVAPGDLLQGEEVVLRSLRLWIIGLRSNAPHCWSRVWNDFAKRFGTKDAGLALSGLAGCIKTLQLNARRKIRHHPPCCRYLAPDEVSFLGFIGACQRADWMLSRHKAEWLVQADGIGDLLEAGSRLAAVLAEHGLMVRDRPASPGNLQHFSQVQALS